MTRHNAPHKQNTRIARNRKLPIVSTPLKPRFNWDGDVIVQDTIVPDKRLVAGYRKRTIATDIRRWVAAKDDAVMREYLRKIEALPVTKSTGDFDKRALAIWRSVNHSFKYKHESNHQDYWQYPEETLALSKGDCEDYTFLLTSLLLASGISPYCVRAVFGVIRKDNIVLGGHVWPMYRMEDGAWTILEYCGRQVPLSLPRKFGIINPCTEYLPAFACNGEHLFKIFPKDPAGVPAPCTSLAQYFEVRNGKVHMIETSLAAGGLLSWNIGHYDLTRDALMNFKVSDSAVTVAADASQEPDFFEFNVPAAHAQTPNDDNSGVTTLTKPEAIAVYTQWMATRIKACSTTAKSDAKGGLFLLGYMLHAVQDLAVHRGITNAQHSYLSYKDKGKSKEVDRALDRMEAPDKIEERITEARVFTERFLEQLEQRRPDTVAALRTYGNAGYMFDRLSQSEKKHLLGISHDLGVSSYNLFRNLSPKYFGVRTRPGCAIADTEWPHEQVFQQVLDML